MINIAVLDDEKIILDMVETLVKVACKGREDVCVRTYLAAEDMLTDIGGNVRFDIVISDVEMPGMNGIELGRLLKGKCPSAHLVYLTSYSEYAAESYIVAAYQYIMKSDVEQRLPGILNELLDKVSAERKDFLVLGNMDDRKKIFHSNILYVRKEKGSKYVEYVTTEGDIRERESVESVLAKINSPLFVMVDRGVVVNLKHIKRISGNVIYMADDVRFTASRRRLTEVKERLNKYWGCI